jgi:hypothetical protein
MSFSLALAAGVMMTISFVSILPECFTDKTVDENGESSNILLPLGWTLITRVISFCLGAGLYFILSWCMTEPEQLLRDNISSIVGSQNIKCSYDDASDDIDIMLEDQRFLSENIRNRHFSHNSRSSSSDSLVTQQTNSWNSPTSLGLKDNINFVSWTMGKDLKKEHQEAWR